jgi:hypothetical protein
MNTFYLFLMCIVYLIVIIYTLNCYNNNISLSNIICNDNNIIIGMLIMSFITILYENDRKNNMSKWYILFLLISIFIVLTVNEESIIHIIFAIIAFSSIFLFMYNERSDSKTLKYQYYIQILFSLYLIYMYIKDSNILYSEILILFNFAIYYIYLHMKYYK